MPSWATWNDVPVGEQNVLQALMNQWEPLVGFQIPLNNDTLLAVANAGGGASLFEFSQVIWGQLSDHAAIKDMSWAMYGLDKDQYVSLATTYGGEWKRLTGQEIGKGDLASAFQSAQRGAGGLLSGSEYAQQLLSDVSMQKTYGWLKYGMDYNQFQQQKIAMRGSFGQELDDHQAVTQLQYWHQNASASNQARAQQAQDKPKEAAGTAGVSVIR